MLIKLIVHPLITWVLAFQVFQLPPLWAYAALLLSALPTGTGPFMLAEFYRREASVVSSSILLSTLGSLFSLVPYAHLVLEQARATDVSPDLVDQICSVLVRDLSGLAVQLNGREGATAEQAEGALALVRRPASDDDRYDRVWKRVHGQSGAYAIPL